MSKLSRLYGNYSFTTHKQAKINDVIYGHFKLFFKKGT